MGNQNHSSVYGAGFKGNKNGSPVFMMIYDCRLVSIKYYIDCM